MQKASATEVADFFFGLALAERVAAGLDYNSPVANQELIKEGSLKAYVRSCETSGRNYEAALICAFYDLSTTAVITPAERDSINHLLAVAPRCCVCNEKVAELLDVHGDTVFCSPCGPN